MSGYYKHNITEDLKSGIDLYSIIIYKKIYVDISISTTSDQSALQIQYAQSSPSAEISSSVEGTRVATVSSSINIAGAVLTLGTEEQYSNIPIDITSSMAVIGTKITSTSCSIAITADVTTTPIKITYALILIYPVEDMTINAHKLQQATIQGAISLTVDVLGTEIRPASASINGLSVVLALTKEILFGSTSISVLNTSMIANAIKFAVDNEIDTAGYRTLFVLDDKPLTNQGRTFSSDLNMDFIESKNWNNTKSRYYKRQGLANPTRKTFSLSWTYLPSSRYDTIDKRYARDYIKGLASDPDVHTLKMLNNDSDGSDAYTETEYTVFVKDYSETLTRRDLVSDVYFWECSLTLEEA